MQFFVKEFTRTVSFTYEDIIKKQRFCLFFFFVLYRCAFFRDF